MRENKTPKLEKGEQGSISLLQVLMVPLVVIVLVVIILAADKKEDLLNPSEEEQAAWETEGNPEETENEDDKTLEEAETENEVQSAEETQSTDPFETEVLRKDSDPEILELMKRYFRARASADAQALSQLYGRNDVSEQELVELEKRLQSISRYVQTFEHVATYVMDAAEPDTWLVYAVTDIRFHTVKTAAPMIMWTFVKKSADEYILVSPDQLTKNQLRLVDVAGHSEEIRRLASSVNEKLKEALMEDGDLNTVYGVLRDGSPVWEGKESSQPVVVIGEEQEETEEQTEKEQIQQPEPLQTETEQKAEIEKGA